MAFVRGWLVVWAVVGGGLRAAADLVLPSRCAACHGPSAARCAARAPRPSARRLGRRTGRGRSAAAACGDAVCRAGARFEGPLRLAVTAYKDEGRRDLRDDLARLLAGAALGRHARPGRAAADRAGGGGARRARADLTRHRVVGAATTRSVTSPSRRSRRSTGSGRRRPVAHRRAAARRARSRLVVVHALVHTRRVADQAHLDRRARADNLAGAMAVSRAVARGRRGGHLRGGRRRRHDRRDARRGGPRTARRRCPARGRGDVCHHTSPRPDPALVAHWTSD